MNEEDKMFNLGLWVIGFVFLLTAALQVCYRTNDRMRNNVHSKIVKIQQEIAENTTQFSSYVRPEVLRNLVSTVHPKSEVISYNKTISINDLPIKQ